MPPGPFRSWDLGGGLRFETWLAPPPFDVVRVRQVHGARVVLDHEARARPGLAADGVVSRDPRPPLAVLTADCLPVALVGRRGAALLHAGWRGIRAGVLENPLLAEASPVSFFVGPCISARAFEVTGEFRGRFPRSPHFATAGGRTTFSLVDEALDRLRRAFPGASVAVSGLCTVANPPLHSHRRDRGGAGRNWNVLRRAGAGVPAQKPCSSLGRVEKI